MSMRQSQSTTCPPPPIETYLGIPLGPKVDGDHVLVVGAVGDWRSKRRPARPGAIHESGGGDTCGQERLTAGTSIFKVGYQLFQDLFFGNSPERAMRVIIRGRGEGLHVETLTPPTHTIRTSIGGSRSPGSMPSRAATAASSTPSSVLSVPRPPPPVALTVTAWAATRGSGMNTIGRRIKPRTIRMFGAKETHLLPTAPPRLPGGPTAPKPAPDDGVLPRDRGCH